MNNITIKSLNELQNYNNRLIPAIEKDINYFRTQKEDKGINLFIVITEGLDWIIEVIYHTNEWLRENEVIVDINKLKEDFQEMLDAVKNHDFVLLTDILEYEILPFLKGLQKRLSEVLS